MLVPNKIFIELSFLFGLVLPVEPYRALFDIPVASL